MTVTQESPAASSVADGPLSSLWAEVTGMCQLSCVHCYAGSGPDGTHGTMTADDWEKVLMEAAALGARNVCFIGGEPTLYPALPGLVRHALGLGMEAEVYTNLVRVRPELWELFGTPGVRLATSWYSNDRVEHKLIAGRDTFRQTLANIEEVLRRGIKLRVGLIDGILPGQHAKEGAELLRARGVVDIDGDHVREFGRGTNPDPSQACGNCGHRRAAVLPDGAVTPCPLTRWMKAGNVTRAPLADILGSVTRMAATLPARMPTCEPDTCFPDWKPCKPNRSAAQSRSANRACNPACGPDAQEPCPPNCRPSDSSVQSLSIQPMRDPCMPDHWCNPTCTPGACTPNI